MLIITDVETVDSKTDGQKFLEAVDDIPELQNPSIPIERRVEIAEEAVKGRRFVRPSDGMDVVIGMTCKAQKELGLMYECWESVASDLNKANRSVKIVTLQLELLRAASFWQRVKMVFTGYKGA